MELVLTLVGVTLTVILVARLCEPLGVAPPLALLAVGIVGSVVPGVPAVALSPDVVLAGLLPPLLYSAAIGTSLVDIRAQITPILGFAVGLVLFTAVGVALVVSWLLPVPFAVAFALGAIVAPPDAVATTAVARRMGLPRGTTTILEGESLLNDATALVSLRTALAAAGLGAVGTTQVTSATVAVDFLIAAIGGVAVGVAAFFIVGKLRRHLTETVADTALSFTVPFGAYATAEEVGASGVLAVVTAGLLLAHRSTVLQSASSRVAERINWSSITFVLENAVFLLIGMQAWQIVNGMLNDGADSATGLLAAGAVLLVVLALRPLYMVPFVYIARHRVARERMRATLVGSWAGMRGVVTLAGALSLPENTPQRPTLIFIALTVTVGTLVLQGSTLPAVARALDVRGPDPREDAMQEAVLVQATTGAGLRMLEDDPASDPAMLDTIRTQARMRVNRIWERLGRHHTDREETPSEAYRRMRLAMIAAEREELLRIRGEGQVESPVLGDVLRGMDAEEAALTWNENRSEEVREAILRAPDAVASSCEHLAAADDSVPPRTPEGCEECLRDGTAWVHLRVCLDCGHVGCCDSSVGQHARAHFHETGHPVMRSLEPGEAWRWCFVDEVLG